MPVNDADGATRHTLTMFAQQSDQRTVRAPYNVLHRWRRDLCDRLLLLDVVQYDRRRRAQDQTRGSSIEDVVCLHRWLY